MDPDQPKPPKGRRKGQKDRPRPPGAPQRGRPKKKTAEIEIGKSCLQFPTRSRVLTQSALLAPQTHSSKANTEAGDAGDDGDDELEYGDEFTVEDMLEMDRLERVAGQGESNIILLT